MNAAPEPARIKTIIVDDEPLGRANITTLLRRDPKIEIVAECGSAMQALETIRSLRPDLLFLDVQMPEHDGFDLLELLGADAPSAVVFVTAHDQYALQAFEAAALDYLLKPFSNQRFAKTLARAKQRLASRGPKPTGMDRIVVKSAGRVAFLKTSEIDWIEAADYYACLHLGPRTFLLRRTLSDLERDLSQERFCRIHRSTIVNLDRVRELRFSSDGEYEVILKDASRLGLSRRYRKLLQTRLAAART